MRTLNHMIFWNLLALSGLPAVLFSSITVENVTVFRIIYVSTILALNISVYFLSRKNRPKTSRTKRSTIALVLVFIVCLIYALYFMYGHIAVESLGGWDAWIMWTLKARDYALTFLGGMRFEWIRADWGHPGYPPALPLQIAGLAVLVGGWSQWIVYAVHLAYWLWTIGMFFDLVRNAEFHPVSVLLIICMLLMDRRVFTVGDQIADFPLSAILMYVWYVFLVELMPEFDRSERFNVDKPRVFFFGMAFWAALSMLLFLKDEGLILAGIHALGISAVIWKTALRFPRSWYSVGAVLFCFALGLLWLFKHNSPEVFQFKVEPMDIVVAMCSLERWLNVIVFTIFYLDWHWWMPVVLPVLSLLWNRKYWWLWLPMVIGHA
ncbi:MAG: hypothetical protein KDK30_17105, partial [Leptospiraceae bacterium]|nr:hypothetical protein [Leptospiraceae bacterium]